MTVSNKSGPFGGGNRKKSGKHYEVNTGLHPVQVMGENSFKNMFGETVKKLVFEKTTQNIRKTTNNELKTS